MKNLLSLINSITIIKIVGERNRIITNVASLNNLDSVKSDTLLWVSEKNIEAIKNIKTGIVICGANAENEDINYNCTYLIVENPRISFFKAVNFIFKEENEKTEYILNNYISPKASVGDGVVIGGNTIIEEDCIIGNNVSIGYNNVILKNTIIEDNVKIGSNNTIGGTGFGYEKNEKGEYEQLLHLGGVYIQKDVEISNNVCIDRGAIDNTVIGRGTKVDNLVHIAHGVIIGKNCLIIANSMIAGSVQIGDDCWVAPSVSIKNKLNIGKSSLLGLGATVIKDVSEESIVVGNPARPIKSL